MLVWPLLPLAISLYDFWQRAQYLAVMGSMSGSGLGGRGEHSVQWVGGELGVHVSKVIIRWQDSISKKRNIRLRMGLDVQV